MAQQQFAPRGLIHAQRIEAVLALAQHFDEQARPADDLAGIADDERIVGDRAAHHGTGADDAIRSDARAAEDQAVLADEAVVADGDGST